MLLRCRSRLPLSRTTPFPFTQHNHCAFVGHRTYSSYSSSRFAGWEQTRRFFNAKIVSLGTVAITGLALSYTYLNGGALSISENLHSGIAHCEKVGDESDDANLHTDNNSSTYYKYVIVGSGTTAYAALEAINQSDPQAEVLMVVDAQRMQRLDAIDTEVSGLSNDLEGIYNEWRRHLQSRLEAFKAPSSNPTYPDENIPAVVVSAYSKIQLNPERREIVMGDGSTITYGSCLVAPTGQPRNFYVIESDKMTYSLRGNINTLQTREDFKELERMLQSDGRKHVTVVGGGYLGTELVMTLAAMGMKEEKASSGTRKLDLTHVFVEPSPLYRHVPEYLSSFIKAEADRIGIDTVEEKVVTAITSSEKRTETDGGSVLSVTLMDWKQESLETDYVLLASTTVEPAVEVLNHTGLEMDPVHLGLVVNSSLEAYDRVFVAGNSASFYDPVLGRRRVQCYDHAVNSGLCAGMNMVAKVAPERSSKQSKRIKQYRHQPVFRSNLAGIGMTLEGVGIVDSKLETVGVWLANRDEETGKPHETHKFERGIVYYLRGNTIVGILCCNASECLGMARDVINKQERIVDYQSLKYRIQLAPESWLNVVTTPPYRLARKRSQRKSVPELPLRENCN